jgi:hypothetical protein
MPPRFRGKIRAPPDAADGAGWPAEGFFEPGPPWAALVANLNARKALHPQVYAAYSVGWFLRAVRLSSPSVLSGGPNSQNIGQKGRSLLAGAALVRESAAPGISRTSSKGSSIAGAPPPV